MVECLVHRNEENTERKKDFYQKKITTGIYNHISKSSKSLTSLTYLYLWDALGFFALGDELLIYFTFLWLFSLKLGSIFTVVTSINVHDTRRGESRYPCNIKNRDNLHRCCYKEYITN